MTLEDDRHPTDEPAIKRIIQVAHSGIADLPKGDKLRLQLQSMVTSIVGSCNELDEIQNWAETSRFLEAIEAAFAIGAICGKPTDASHVGSGRKGRGGRVQGQKAKERATAHKASLLPLFRSLRAKNPAWLDAKLVREARVAYGDRLPVLPGDKQVSNYLAEMVASGSVADGPKDGRSKKVRKRAS